MNNYLANYLEELRNKGSVEMAESIEETSTKFSKEHLASLSFSSWETGLLFGNGSSFRPCLFCCQLWVPLVPVTHNG